MRGTPYFLVGSILVATLLAPVCALAEKPETVYETLKNEKNKDLYEVNIAVPTAAALSVVGAKDVAAIGADIAPDVYYHFTPKDDGVPEMAISIRPYWVFFNPNQTIKTYQSKDTSSAERIFARTRVSLAAANNSDGKGFALGAGLNTMLTGKSDPRNDSLFLGCLQTGGHQINRAVLDGAAVNLAERSRALGTLKTEPVYMNADAAHRAAADQIFTTADKTSVLRTVFYTALQSLGVTDPDVGGRLYDKWEEDFTPSEVKIDIADYNACVSKATTRYQTQRAWAVGTGLAYRADTRDFNALEYAGVSVWTTYKLPLFGVSSAEKENIKKAKEDGTDAGQNAAEGDSWKGSLLLSARYISDDKAPSGTVSEKASTLIAAAQFQASRGALELSLTAAGYDNNFEKAALTDDKFARYSATAKVPIGEGLAIDLSVGSTSGRAHKEDEFAIFRITATGKALKNIGKAKTFLGL
jgi:hypothetical protein